MLRGMHDILPDDWLFRERVGAVSRKFAEFYNFDRIETPILEDAGLFTRAIGADTDVVEKEMYLIKTKGGDTLALRPENTAGIARAYAEHKLSRGTAFQKLWHSGPMFRHDRPQSGRFRQFTQFGLEIIGTNDPLYDAEVMLIFWKLLEELKLKGLVLKINSIGCRICRPAYIRQLQNYYKTYLKQLCEDCVRRLETNPLRLLDCSREECATHKIEAPSFFDKLCSPCSGQLTGVLEYLDEAGIPYTLDNLLARGLDYYARTVFEISIEGPGEEMRALAGGGRYDYLFETLGLKSTAAVGGALGIERVVGAMRAQEIVVTPKPERRIFLMHVGELAKKKLLRIIEELRLAGIPVDEALSKDSLTAQLKFANKDGGSALALIVGQKEIFEGSVIIRDMKHSTQETVPLTRMVEEVKKRLK